MLELELSYRFIYVIVTFIGLSKRDSNNSHRYQLYIYLTECIDRYVKSMLMECKLVSILYFPYKHLTNLLWSAFIASRSTVQTYYVINTSLWPHYRCAKFSSDRILQSRFCSVTNFNRMDGDWRDTGCLRQRQWNLGCVICCVRSDLGCERTQEGCRVYRPAVVCSQTAPDAGGTRRPRRARHATRARHADDMRPICAGGKCRNSKKLWSSSFCTHWYTSFCQ